MMNFENEWRHGETDFRISVPPDRLGTTGCVLLPVIVDPGVGVETILLFTDDPKHMDGYAAVAPMNLVATTGLIRTPYGPVAFIVWRVAANSPAECFMEQFLNPASPQTCDLVVRAGKQSHLKFVIADNQSSKISAFVDFENCFALDELADMMCGVEATEPLSRFSDAVVFVTENYDLISTARG